MVDRSIPPQIYSFSDITFPLLESIRLDNGATLHVYNKEGYSLVQIHLIWTGGKYDFENPAIAQLLVQSLRDGTMNYSAEQVEEILDFNGATLKCEVRDHFTILTVNCLSERIAGLIPVLKEIIGLPTFPNNRLKKHKERLIANLDISRKKPDYHAERGSNLQISGYNHPINREITPQDISSVSTETLIAAHKAIMSPSQLNVYIAGTLPINLLTILKQFIEGLDCSHTGLGESMIIPFKPQSPGKEILTDVPHSLQSSVYISIPTIGRNDKDYCLLRMATFALGGYFGSRLMTNIREEKGLTYNITAGLYGYAEGSSVIISSQCDNKSVGLVIKETSKELSHLAQNPPEGQELERVIQSAYTALASTLDSPFNVISNYVTYHALFISPDYFYRQLDAIKSLSPQLISEMASKYLAPDKSLISVAGDLNSIVK